MDTASRLSWRAVFPTKGASWETTDISSTCVQQRNQHPDLSFSQGYYCENNERTQSNWIAGHSGTELSYIHVRRSAWTLVVGFLFALFFASFCSGVSLCLYERHSLHPGGMACILDGVFGSSLALFALFCYDQRD
ncbi:hypothetical protein B0T19DRAFT_429218, partial [Cercophora scortea]